MIHPDVEAAISTLVEELVPAEQVVLRLDAEFTNGPMPVVLINAGIPGPDVLSTVQVEVEVYHNARTAAKQLTTVLLSHLADKHHDTPAGFLDRVYVRQEPKELPYQFSGVERFQFVLNVDTRPV